jgi:hypothetical protein
LCVVQTEKSIFDISLTVKSEKATVSTTKNLDDRWPRALGGLADDDNDEEDDTTSPLLPKTPRAKQASSGDLGDMSDDLEKSPCINPEAAGVIRNVVVAVSGIRNRGSTTSHLL